MASTALPQDETHKAFAQINTTLVERGLLAAPLLVNDLTEAPLKQLSDLLHTLLRDRLRDADLRLELASKNRALESSLDRTKKFWKEDEEKRAEGERKLEASKASMVALQEQANTLTATNKKMREDLQKVRKELLTVKQQAAQQRLANDRQSERLRARYLEESIKSLRTQVVDVYMATPSSSSSTSTRASIDPIALAGQRQVEELESRRRELMDYNAALKRMATECIGLARKAAAHMEELGQESGTGGTTGQAPVMGSDSEQLFQRDLFPALQPLRADYTLAPSGSSLRSTTTQQQFHPAVLALTQTHDVIEQHSRRFQEGKAMRVWARIQEARQRMRTSVSSTDTVTAAAAPTNDAPKPTQQNKSLIGNPMLARLFHAVEASETSQSDRDQSYRSADETIGPAEQVPAADSAKLQAAMDKIARLEAELNEVQQTAEDDCLRNEELQAQVKMYEQESGRMGRQMSTLMRSGDDYEEKEREIARQMAEVERQRQRYLDLCQALEEQEKAMAEERQRVVQQTEQLTMDHSLSMLSASVEATPMSNRQFNANRTADISLVSTVAGEQSQDPTLSAVLRPAMLSEMYASTPLHQMTMPTHRSLMKRMAPTPAPHEVDQSATPSSMASMTPLTETKRNAPPGSVGRFGGLGMPKRVRTEPPKTLVMPSSSSTPAPRSTSSSDENKTGTQVIGGREMRFITMRKQQRPSQR